MHACEHVMNCLFTTVLPTLPLNLHERRVRRSIICVRVRMYVYALLFEKCSDTSGRHAQQPPAATRPAGTAQQTPAAKRARGPVPEASSPPSWECKVCFDARISALFMPCRHLVCCMPCANLSERCPVCREAISERMRVFAG